jgi:hypothetical protein
VLGLDTGLDQRALQIEHLRAIRLRHAHMADEHAKSPCGGKTAAASASDWPRRRAI